MASADPCLVVGQAYVMVARQLRPRRKPGRRALRLLVAGVQQHQLHPPDQQCARISMAVGFSSSSG